MYIPNSTYRIQLHKDFNFKQLDDIIDYLHKLGISTIYASPVTRSVKGSTHGYDDLNPHEINPEIGTVEQWASINKKLRKYQMGWLQDIVPNHMAFTPENKWVFDMLERGRHSKYYYYFDLISQFHKPDVGEEKIMVPFLGRSLEECLNNKEIKMECTPTGISIVYGQEKYPLSAESFQWIASFPNASQLLKTWCEKMQPEEYLTQTMEEWTEQKNFLFNELYAANGLKQELTARLNQINDSPDLMLQLLRFQHYTLTEWKESQHKMNYRRFFAVNALICLRMQDKIVFDDWHELTFGLFERGFIQGFRIDHIDGLFDPEGYLSRLRKLMGDEAYIVSEKILQEKEETLKEWPVQGTSGYEFLSVSNQLMCDIDGKSKLIDFYKAEVIKDEYPDIVFEKKYQFLKKELGGELANLMRWLMPWLHAFQLEPDVPKLREALAVLMSAFPVYRVYVRKLPINKNGHAYIRTAFSNARARRPEFAEQFDILEKVFATKAQDPSAKHALLFIQRFAQYTAPLAAKGVEDTAFYCYNAFIGHNEVGDSPAHRPVDVARFHDIMCRRNRNANFSLNATSTHDTKRGEDNRLRINLISQYPDEWIALIKQIKNITQPFVGDEGDNRSPSLNDEYLIYQSLLGAIPADMLITDNFLTRFKAFLQKAQREEKVNTTWAEPNENYENKSFQFVKTILENRQFQEAFFPFVRKIISDALSYSLTQTLLKMTTPGIPDIYQGAELWDLTFVDPDNRATVDFKTRKQLLDQLTACEKEGINHVLRFAKERAIQGAQKMFLIKRILCFRNEYPALFNGGEYRPIPCDKGWVAYIRKNGDQEILVYAPVPVQNRQEIQSALLAAPPDDETFVIRADSDRVKPTLQGRWKNLITNQEIELYDRLHPGILNDFPVAALLPIN